MQNPDLFYFPFYKNHDSIWIRGKTYVYRE
jgi:hypothetical protein